MTRTLVVGPMGSEPWVPLSEYVARLEALGHDVIVNGEPDFVMPLPDPHPLRLGSFVNSLPGFVGWQATSLARWRRRARRSVAGAHVDTIVVWDEVLALLCGFARPRDVEVIWITDPPEGTRLYQRVRRAVASRRADRVVTSWPDHDPSL